MSMPQVSVVIPTYCDPQHTLEAIASVRAQDMADWEAIIVDDGSDAASRSNLSAKISALCDPRLRYVPSSRNRGPARARNLGIRLARGRFLAFLDADDLWHPEKLRLQRSAMQEVGLGLSCTAYENVDLQTGHRTVRVPPSRITYNRLLYRNTIGCSTVMIDRMRIPRSYFPEIDMRQDFAHWLAILKHGEMALGLTTPLTQRRQFPTSLSANKHQAARYTWRMYRDIEGFGYLRAGWYFMGYALSSVLAR
ncbi:MAG: glycosyltransferase family 2 protein [Pseudomonadota bacterium]